MTRIACLLLVMSVVSGKGYAQEEEIKPNPKVDAAISKALQFLAVNQKRTGAWEIGGNESMAGTSLAVMAFLAAGHLPDEGPYGASITKGVNWVLDNQHESGVLSLDRGHGQMYNHGITTLMLGEVVGLMPKRDAKKCRKALEAGILVILFAQNRDKQRGHVGGWRYTPSSTDSDLSVTAWQLLALRAAKNVGCDVPAENIDAAIEYVKQCFARNRGFGYMPSRGATPTMTGTGITALEVCGVHRSAEILTAARQLLSRPLQKNDSYFFYGAYYSSVGMFKVGDLYWTQTYEHLTNVLLTMQNRDGSWVGNGSERNAGSIYATSLAVLALGVEYRYLPIYQR